MGDGLAVGDVDCPGDWPGDGPWVGDWLGVGGWVGGWVGDGDWVGDWVGVGDWLGDFVGDLLGELVGLGADDVGVGEYVGVGSCPCAVWSSHAAGGKSSTG